MIPYGRQDIRDEDVAAIEKVLRSTYLTQGPSVPLFEEAVASHVGAAHAIGVNSATSALHIACLALGAGPGDLVWTTANTFVASANCALYCGANVDFVDIDPRTYNLCARALESKLKEAKARGSLPKIVIPVAFAGQSCDMRRIKELSDEYGFSIIEDASHAIGGFYLGEKIGCGKYADITIFSFHPVKIITTAEGGMALTQSDDLAQKMRLFRSHGITRDEDILHNKPDGPWYYEQLTLGFNYRMTDLQGALGLSQLARIDEYVERRHEIAERYRQGLNSEALVLPYQHEDGHSALHLYPICLVDSRRRNQVFSDLRKKNIMVNVHYIPVYTQPFYLARGHQRGECPVAESYYAGAISLPMFPTLSLEDQQTVINSINIAVE